MSTWYRNYYGDSLYNRVVQNRKGYYRYEIKFINDNSFERIIDVRNKPFDPTLHKIISLEELSDLFKDHWIQENGNSRGFSGKIHVDTELDYKEVLLDLEMIFETNLHEKYNFRKNLDYEISELGYINLENRSDNFSDNYWLKKYHYAIELLDKDLDKFMPTSLI